MSAVVLYSAVVLCIALWCALESWGRFGRPEGTDCVRQVSNRSEKNLEGNKECGIWSRPHLLEQPLAC